jgi:hypothetical protein
LGLGGLNHDADHRSHYRFLVLRFNLLRPVLLGAVQNLSEAVMIPLDDVVRERVHADVGKLLYCMRDTVEQLIAIRVREHGPVLDGEEAELMAIYQSMQWLLSDIQAMHGHIKRIKNDQT